MTVGDDDVESATWSPGGIFGHGGVEAGEVLEELGGGPFPNASGGIRDRPGYGNVLGADDAVRRRRMQMARRGQMLIAERLIDEWPDLRDKLIDRIGGPDGLRGKLILKIRRVNPEDLLDEARVAPDDTVPKALGDRLKDATFDVTAEIFRRAYAKDIERAQAATRLGAFEGADWAFIQATKVLTSPYAVASAIVRRVERLTARVEHVIAATREPLPEPEEVDKAPTEPEEEEDEDAS